MRLVDLKPPVNLKPPVTSGTVISLIFLLPIVSSLDDVHETRCCIFSTSPSVSLYTIDFLSFCTLPAVRRGVGRLSSLALPFQFYRFLALGCIYVVAGHCGCIAYFCDLVFFYCLS